MFSVYSAKSIAGIALEKHLPDSTLSRGIVINLRRKLPHESVERLRYADDCSRVLPPSWHGSPTTILSVSDSRTPIYQMH